MYPVSEAFLEAVKQNTRRYYWTGRITTKTGVIYNFGKEDIVKGSGSITAQCCGNTEIELGTVYAAELDISLFANIDRYTLQDALVEMFYHLKVADSGTRIRSMSRPQRRTGYMRQSRWGSMKCRKQTGRLRRLK